MTPLMEFAWSTAVKATVILAAAAAISWLLRARPAALRHLVWSAAFAALLVLPLGALLPSAWSVNTPAVLVAPGIVETVSAPAASASASWRGAWPWVWLGGALALLLRWAAAAVRLGGVASTARPATEFAAAEDLDCSRRIDVRVTPGLSMPATWGLFRPLVLLPAASANWSAGRRRVVLLHELAHVVRRDPFWHAIGELARAVYWFHPLVWWSLDRMAEERERAADDFVLSSGAGAPDYAAHLLELARAARRDALAVAALPMAASSRLERRLAAILDPRLRRHPASLRFVAEVAIVGLLLLVPLAALRPPAAAAPDRSVFGLVVDPSGAVVPGAKITLIGAESGYRDSTTTGEDGQYRFPPVPAGRYRLELEKPGFPLTAGYVMVPPNGAARRNFFLNLGQISEELVVTSTRPAGATPRPTEPQRVRVGGNVQAAKLVKHVRPAYPDEAKTRGLEGAVVLRAVILMSGKVGGVEVASSPDPVLSQAAADCVRQWEYEPTLLNGKPVEVVTNVTIQYRLTDPQ